MNRILNIIIIVLVIIISSKMITNFKQQENPYMITPKEVQEKINNNEEFILLDVRTREEFEQGRIPGSILVPLDKLEESTTNLLSDKDEEIIVYCRSGNRSNTARRILFNMGYKKVYDLGGIVDWPYEVER